MLLNIPSAEPVKQLLDRAGGRAELLLRFTNARGYEILDWNRIAAELFTLEPSQPGHPPIGWDQIPRHLAQYLCEALQLVSGAPEEPMPDLAHSTRPEQHYFAKVFYQVVPPVGDKEEEHWFLFCFQDSVNWLEHSQGAVNRKKLETIGELASGVAHDFNNLIMGIQSNAEAMLAQPSMTPQAREGLVNIIRGCSTGTSLTRSLLGYAKRQPLALAPFNLTDLAHDVTRIAGVASGKYQVVLGKELAEKGTPIMVVGSYSSLSHCVLNLIKNAREAMPNGGTIQVLWEGNETTAMITVRDHGTGISEEDMAHIFEPFFSTKKQGTGLGLAMVRGILHQHAGRVEIRSTVGMGTSVSLVWPRGEIKARTGSVTRPLADMRQSTQKIVRQSKRIYTEGQQQTLEGRLSIFVIDDDDLVREGLCSLLEHLGHRTESFREPDLALQKLIAADPGPDVVMVDFNMPGMTGTQFIGSYSTSEAGTRPSCQTQILLMSGMPPSHFDDFLSEFAHVKVSIMEKPFSLATLRKRLGAIQEARKEAGGRTGAAKGSVDKVEAADATTRLALVKNGASS